jgi:predicted DNA-binding protein with PD1-like motif
MSRAQVAVHNLQIVVSNVGEDDIKVNDIIIEPGHDFFVKIDGLCQQNDNRLVEMVSVLGELSIASVDAYANVKQWHVKWMVLPESCVSVEPVLGHVATNEYASAA